jgi:hypothetical protein
MNPRDFEPTQRPAPPAGSETTRRTGTPWFLWPLVALWQALWALVTSILTLVGRIICAVLGLALMMVGGLLAMTLVAAWVGVPIFTFGLLLLVRALF